MKSGLETARRHKGDNAQHPVLTHFEMLWLGRYVTFEIVTWKVPDCRGCGFASLVRIVLVIIAKVDGAPDVESKHRGE